jgi:hypothetical protein
MEICDCRNSEEMSFDQGKSNASVAATTFPQSLAVAEITLAPAKKVAERVIATKVNVKPRTAKKQRRSSAKIPNSPISDDDESPLDEVPETSHPNASRRRKSKLPDSRVTSEIEKVTASFKKQIEDL